jgi:hypothetical protein
MTLRDYRLTAATTTWTRAQLQPAAPRRRRWLVRHARQLRRRATRCARQLEAAR